MSSYFDEITHAISEVADVEGITDEVFLAEVERLEEQMYRDVVQVTGDREFPVDLRERILGVFAVYGIYQPGKLEPTREARETVVATRSSIVVESLHSMFHDVARRGIQTRFGRLSDSPTQILVLRDEYEEELRGAVQG